MGRGQSRDTHVVISHVLFTFLCYIKGVFWWSAEMTPSGEYPD